MPSSLLGLHISAISFNCKAPLVFSRLHLVSHWSLTSGLFLLQCYVIGLLSLSTHKSHHGSLLDGQLFQVKYALEAVRKGNAAIDIRGCNPVVLCMAKKSTPKLQDSSLPGPHLTFVCVTQVVVTKVDLEV